jgi:hypothetical protein
MAKQAAVGATLQTIDDYARLSAAAGGFDRADAQLNRRLVRLDAEGFAELSQACTELLERAEEIEARAEARIKRDPHADGHVEAGIALLLFEAVRLTAAAGRERTGARRRSSPRT